MVTPESPAVLALAGGVGGAKLALGLARCLPSDDLVICVNTGDDETFHGLHVSPDLDTMMYTLSGFSNQETGWGVAGDTFTALEMLGKFGVDTWFNLGDRDFATHIRRSQLLAEGKTLSEVTSELNQSLGVFHSVVPMSNDPVKTVLSTDEGELPMQRYFVGRRAEPKVFEVRYVGVENATAAPGLLDSLAKCCMLVLCPSNPYLSLGPILALPGVRQLMRDFSGKQPPEKVRPNLGLDEYHRLGPDGGQGTPDKCSTVDRIVNPAHLGGEFFSQLTHRRGGGRGNDQLEVG